MEEDAKIRAWGLKDIMDRFKDRRFLYPLVLASILEGFAHVDDWVRFEKDIQTNVKGK